MSKQVRIVGAEMGEKDGLTDFNNFWYEYS